MTTPQSENGKLLVRIDERVKALDGKVTLYHDELCKRLDDHEERLRNLEGSNRKGVVADIGALGTAAGAAILALVKQSGP